VHPELLEVPVVPVRLVSWVIRDLPDQLDRLETTGPLATPVSLEAREPREALVQLEQQVLLAPLVRQAILASQVVLGSEELLEQREQQGQRVLMETPALRVRSGLWECPE